MIIPREYKPAKDEILYHYCDANAFLSICTNKRMRFSDIFAMNDSLEMHWGYSIWEIVANELLDEIGKEFLDKIDEFIHISGIHGLLVNCSYSLEGDVLSQWRAYADDGKGYAIGFNAKDLVDLSVRPLKVQYSEEEQIKELKNVVRALHEVESGVKNKFSKDFARTCFNISYDLAAYKNPAFSEEKEVRLVHILDFEQSNDALRLEDAGGCAFGKKAKGVPVQFRMRESIPVAYIELDFSNKNKVNPIKEVVIGPKNQSMPLGISICLETLGIGSVNVRKSKASYR